MIITDNYPAHSYLLVISEDCSEMTAASPLIIDVGDMKVECVVGEKNGTATLATQTEQVGLTWRSRGGHVAVTWRSRGCHVEVTWLSRGGHVAVK